MNRPASARVLASTFAVIVTLVLTITASGCAGETSASAACEDTVDALTDASMRCGSMDRASARAEILRVSAAGDCKNVLRIRSETELRGTCFPWLDKADCQTLKVGPIDPSCVDQLERAR